jgi:hypothetical protein
MDQTFTPTSLSLDRILAIAGTPAAKFARLWQNLWVQPYVTPTLLEMCRLTLARLHRDTDELAANNPHVEPDALSAGRRAVVVAGQTHRAADFSATERAVLDFAECYAMDPQSIPDDTAEQVKTLLGEPGLVFLIEALGCIDARIRSARCLRDIGRVTVPAGPHGE